MQWLWEKTAQLPANVTMVTLDTTALHTTVSRSGLEIQFYRKRNDAHHMHWLSTGFHLFFSTWR